MTTPIAELGLSTRTERALTRHGITTFEGLLELTPRRVSVIRGVGETRTLEVLYALERVAAVYWDPDPLVLLKARPNDTLREIFTSAP